MFREYIALGDSMSIDLYPALDVGETDVAVALERDPSAGHVTPLGAASLLYRNDEGQWPDEVGEDLFSRYPGITFTNFAADAATIGDVFGGQVPELPPTDEPTLVTLTVGMHDLLSPLANKPRRATLEAIALDAFNAHVRALAARGDHVALADAYLHFLGHGATAPEADRWFWRRSPLEPNARGANALRHVWLDALDRVEQAG